MRKDDLDGDEVSHCIDVNTESAEALESLRPEQPLENDVRRVPGFDDRAGGRIG